jgi:hypothetical protein
MQLLKASAKDGKAEEVVWGNKEKEITRWAAFDRIVVPAVALPPLEAGSVYVLQVKTIADREVSARIDQPLECASTGAPPPSKECLALPPTSAL